MTISQLIALSALNAALLWEAGLVLGLAYVALADGWMSRLRRGALALAVGWFFSLLLWRSCDSFLWQWVDVEYMLENGRLVSSEESVFTRPFYLLRQTLPLLAPALGAAAALVWLARAARRHRWIGGRTLSWGAGAVLVSLTVAHIFFMRIGAGMTPKESWDMPHLLAAVQSTDSRLRDSALKLIGRRGPGAAEAVPTLEAILLSSADTLLRWQAARALGEIGLPAIPALVKGLGHADGKVRLASSVGLAEMGKAAEPALPELARAADDPEARVRFNIFRALAAIGPAAMPAAPALAKTLETGPDELRDSAVKALAAIGPVCLGMVVPVLRGKPGADERGRFAAAKILAGFGSKAEPALPELLRLLGSPNGTECRLALIVLPGLGRAARPAVPLLRKIQADAQASPVLRESAGRLAETLTSSH